MRTAKKLRKLIVAVVTGAMVLGMMGAGVFAAAPTVQTVAFSDISGDQYAAAIDYTAGLGISQGIGNGQFSPAA